jgi:hypothetical protein
MALNKSTKEVLILAGLLVVMTAKILIAVRLIHHWKLQALAEGRPFGDAEDEAAAKKS